MRILVLEDNPLTAMDIEVLIESVTPAEIVVCGSVAGAASECSRREFDFAFLDIDVTDGKSFGLAEVLSRSGTPFAFVSGSRPDEVPAALRSAPFVSKPFTLQTLAAALKATPAYPIPAVALASDRSR